MARSFRGASPDVVDQCQIEVSRLLSEISELRGTSRREEMANLRRWSSQMPTPSEMDSMEDRDLLLAFSPSGDEEVVSGVSFGGSRGGGAPLVPRVQHLAVTPKFPIRFLYGPWAIELTDHAAKRSEKRGVSFEEIGRCLLDEVPEYHRGGPRRFRQGDVCVVAAPTRQGWRVVTCYRWQRKSFVRG